MVLLTQQSRPNAALQVLSLVDRERVFRRWRCLGAAPFRSFRHGWSGQQRGKEHVDLRSPAGLVAVRTSLSYGRSRAACTAVVEQIPRLQPNSSMTSRKKKGRDLNNRTDRSNQSAGTAAEVSCSRPLRALERLLRHALATLGVVAGAFLALAFVLRASPFETLQILALLVGLTSLLAFVVNLVAYLVGAWDFC